MKILNIPNINDPAMDSNYTIIQKLSPNAEIISNAQTYEFMSPVDIFLSYCAEDDLDLIVGNGFGAFLGYILGAELKVRTLLTNPYIPAHAFDIAGLLPYAQELEDLWDKYKGKNTDCHILLSVTDSPPDSNKIMELFKDTADIKLLCTQVFNTDEHSKWINSYL